MTIVIGQNGENCGVIGSFQTGLQWDQATKTCTLTQDLDFSSSPLRNPSPGPSADGFILDFGGLTLDGAGHKIIGEPGESYNYQEVGKGNAGVLINNGDSFVIKNLVIEGFGHGIRIIGTNNGLITGNTLSSTNPWYPGISVIFKISRRLFLIFRALSAKIENQQFSAIFNNKS